MTLMTNKIAFATKHDLEGNGENQQWSKVAKPDAGRIEELTVSG